jgi:hypothetical protein
MTPSEPGTAFYGRAVKSYALPRCSYKSPTGSNGCIADTLVIVPFIAIYEFACPDGLKTAQTKGGEAYACR